ncbi:MAG: hypothetical protein VW338_08820 [Rhodospirillaceae bacterium]|jgi:hypothetical protein
MARRDGMAKLLEGRPFNGLTHSNLEKAMHPALAVVPALLGATWAHVGNGWLFTNQGGGWEYPLFLVVAAAVQALVGGGALQLSRDVEIPVLGRVLTAAR